MLFQSAKEIPSDIRLIYQDDWKNIRGSYLKLIAHLLGAILLIVFVRQYYGGRLSVLCFLPEFLAIAVVSTCFIAAQRRAFFARLPKSFPHLSDHKLIELRNYYDSIVVGKTDERAAVIKDKLAVLEKCIADRVGENERGCTKYWF